MRNEMGLDEASLDVAIESLKKYRQEIRRLSPVFPKQEEPVLEMELTTIWTMLAESTSVAHWNKLLETDYRRFQEIGLNIVADSLLIGADFRPIVRLYDLRALNKIPSRLEPDH